MSRKLAAVLAIAGACQLLQMGFLAEPGVRPGWAFFWAHLAFVFGMQGALALLFARWRDGRVWSAAAFALPVVLSVVSGRLFYSIPETWVVGAACAAGVGALLAAVAGHWPAAPVACATLGCLLGVEVLRFRADQFRGLRTPAGDWVRTILTAALVLACLLLLRRAAAALRTPGTRSLVAGALLMLALAGVLRTQNPWQAALARQATEHGRVGPPIVVIVLDTVRADRLRSYGGARDAMRHLDAFGAQDCLRAARSVASHPSSLETHASFLTGLTPPEHGAHRPFLSEGAANPLYAHPLAERYTTLPELLRAGGYWSVALSGNAGPLSREFGLGQGFDVYLAGPEDVRRRTPWHVPLEFLRPSQANRVALVLPAAWTSFVSTKPYREATVITDEALQVLDAAGEHSLFLFLNYFDAHAPNTPPAPFLDAFPGRIADSDNDGSYEATRRYYGTGVTPNAEEQAHMRALYDGEVAYIDSELGRLFERLRRHPRWKEMQVIVTADHGESLGEHGLVGHGHSLYEQQISVPFFVKPGVVPAPVAVPGVLRDQVIQSTDVFPLVLRQAGIPEPEGRQTPLWGQGRTVTRAWSYCARDHSRWDPGRFEQELRLVEVGSLKLIASSRGTVELYDFVADPLEAHDLQHERPADATRLGALLEPFDTPRGAEVERGDETLKERLHSLGYVQ